MSIFQTAEESTLLGSTWGLTVSDSKRGRSDSIRSPMKGVVAEVLPSLEGGKGADKPESTRILVFFGGARTASGDEWVGQGAQPLVKRGAVYAGSGLGAENML